MKYKNEFDKLLDENCVDTINLTFGGTTVAYEQIAVIPYDNNLYTILIEKSAFEAGDLDSGEVFLIDEDKEEIRQVENVNIIGSIFEIYDRMYQEKQGD